MSTLKKYSEHPLVQKILNWVQTTSYPGSKGLSIYDTVAFVIKECTNDRIITRTNSIAFSFFLSLFPTIIFIFTLIPYFPIDGLSDSLFETTNTMLPENAGQFIFQDIIEDILEVPRSGLLSIGFVLALFFSSNGMLALMTGFNKNYFVFEKRSAWKKRVLAIGLTLLVGSLLLLSLAGIVLGTSAIDLILDLTHISQFAAIAVSALRWTIVVTLLYLIISIIYYFGPSMKSKFSFFSPGATLATTLSIISSIGFAAFINNFGTYNKVYGSIGALIVVMLWIQINAFILLVGFELNASIAVQRSNKILNE